MSDLVPSAVGQPMIRRFLDVRGVRLRCLLRKLSEGAIWLPLVLVLGAIAVVGYADHLIASMSLIYLYILPLVISAVFLRREISCGLIPICILLHDYFSPRIINLALRIFHNGSALLCFFIVVYVIQRYIREKEVLAKRVQQQRDDLLHDVELAAQVQRMFLPSGKPGIAGLEVAGMMKPAKGLSGDYYDYIPINAHTLQTVIADVSGKGVSAALLMSATAAATHIEVNHERDMLEVVERLNTGIRSVSDGEHFVTLLLAEINTQRRTLRYVNCGHNPAFLFQSETGKVTLLNSSCVPIGISAEENCQLASVGLATGDILVFYTDGITEAQNDAGEEFGTKRLAAILENGFSLSAEGLMSTIFSKAADFCSHIGFADDATILIVKCNFEKSW